MNPFSLDHLSFEQLNNKLFEATKKDDKKLFIAVNDELKKRQDRNQESKKESLLDKFERVESMMSTEKTAQERRNQFKLIKN